jgi:nucleotide-binding universal stress UspA family protein
MSKDLQRILVPVDFSPPSEAAVRYASRLARQLDAELLLLHVYPIPGYVLPDGFVAAGPEVLGDIEAKSKDALLHLAQRAKTEWGAQRTAVYTGMGLAAQEIVRIATELQADAICMGAHGRTGLALALLGSTTDRVIHHSLVPVITVPIQTQPST